MSEEALPVGAAVRIVPTQHVLSRMPRVAGKRGIILNVPTHPNTWFKVQVGDEVSIQFSSVPDDYLVVPTFNDFVC